MARIRSIKPEFWGDLALASETSRDARLLYIALWNQADEHGRMHGDRRWIKGHCLPYDDDLTLADIDRLLGELVSAGKVVVYEVGRERFLFLPKLAEHQRLEPGRVESRHPAPPDPSESEPDADSREPRVNESAPRVNESAKEVTQQVAGSREHVAGVPPTADAAPADVTEPAHTTDALVAEWLRNCRKRPPGATIARVGKAIRAMLAEGVDPTDVRAGLAHWHQRGLDPATLPSVVNEVMNASPARGRSPTTDDRVRAGLALAEMYEAADKPPTVRGEIAS